MKVRIAIIEDELQEQKNITGQLHRYEKERGLVPEIDAFEDGADFLEVYRNQFDVIFCDIQMKFTGGIETAEEIRKVNSDVIIIFITNRAEFSIQGYEVDASGYILKPLAYSVLERSLDRVLKRLEQRSESYLVFTQGKNVLRISMDDILYIESVKHYQYIYTPKEVHKVLITMKELEEKVDPAEFARCNNGCLVHLKYVERMEKGEVIVYNTRLSISRGKKKEFAEALTEYMTNNM